MPLKDPIARKIYMLGYSKKWYKLNRDRNIEQAAKYYQDNKEKKLIYSREHRAKNIEKYRASAKRYAEKNKEKIRLSKKLRYRLLHGEPKPRQTEEQKRAYRAKWAREHRDAGRRSELKRQYGITLIQYEEMFKKQQGLCAICGIPQLKLTSRLAVDHCHKTNKVRGLLCKWCNQTLGQFNDDPNRFMRAAEYLNAHQPS